MSFENNLSFRLLALDSQGKYELKNPRLNTLRSLHQAKISWNLLRVVVIFWDLEFHVLRFEPHELCPLAKKFSVILEFSFYFPPIVPASSKTLIYSILLPFRIRLIRCVFYRNW